MNELFTVEEINLICIFDTTDRGRLISELAASVADFDTGDPQSNAEIREIAANTIAKLSDMSDADFTALELYPEYSGGDDYTNENEQE